MPAPGGIFDERPPSVRSGEPLHDNLVVQRRSDMLLDEQMDNVKNVQEALQKALSDMELAKTSDEQEFYVTQAEELQQRCQEMMVVLKIVNKINTELSYARAELQRALAEGTEIHTARKRVGWLENRIEKLLGRERQSNPSRAHMKSVALEDPRFMLNQSLGAASDLDLGPSDGGNHSTFSSGGSAPGLSALSSNDIASLRIGGNADTFKGPNLPVEECLWNEDVPVELPSGREIIKDVQDEEKAIALTHDDDIDEGKITPPGSLKDKSAELAESRASSASSLSSASSSSSLSSSSSSSSSSSDSSHHSSLKSVTQKTPSPPTSRPTSEARRPSTASSMSSRKSEQSKQEATFLTEPEMDHLVSGEEDPSKRSRGSRVTIKTPTEFDEFQQDDIIPSRQSEHGADDTDTYWDSEHHRFEYNEYAPMLLGINPLSYHQMGLAVPGSFVDDVDGDTSLPWRAQSSKSVEIVDIHKKALNKLSLKVHKMYGKVKEASLLSVDKTKEKEYGGPTLMQNFEVHIDTPIEEAPDVSQRDTAVSEPGKTSITKIESGRPSSRENVTLPPVETKRRGTTFAGKLQYYPKPLPQPEKLPITRLNASVEFPPTSDLYSTSVPGVDDPADRIVNQRNLYKETKFTSSLFKSKKANQKKNAASERKFHRLTKSETPEHLHKDPTLSSIGSTFKVAASAVRLSRDSLASHSSASLSRSSTPTAPQRGEAFGRWKDMKPKSGFLDHSGLKWERVKNIVHNSLPSPNDSERVDAARHLGALKCGDPIVVYALRQRLQQDEQDRVVYESMKALMTLGCWDEDILSRLVLYMENGNNDIRNDLLKTIMAAKNVQYVDKRCSSFTALSELISDLCMDDDPQDPSSFNAAVCLGKLCVVDENAIAKLRQVMEYSTNTHDKAQAMEILVQQMNEHQPITVSAVLGQLRNSPVWKYRKDAASHLVTIGPKHVKKNQQLEEVYELLDKRLWDEPNKNVRHEVAKAMAALALYARACEKVEKRLSDPSEDVRAQAVLSIGTLGMKAPRITRVLMEMMELDGSDYVRLMILRTLGALGASDKRAMRMLKDKEKGEGPLAREAKKTLAVLLPNSKEPAKEPKTKSKKV